MLDDKNKEAVKKILAPMKGEVELMFFTSDNCEYCPQEKELLSQIAEVSKVKIKEFKLTSDEAKKYKITNTPTILFSKKPNIRIMGLPSGHEFRTFLDTILMIDKGMTELKDEVKNSAKEIGKKTDIKVFVTPTCPYCPSAVFSSHQLAMENDNVTSTMVEATEFQKLSQQHGVMSVPKIVVNDDKSWEGAVPDHIFIKKVSESL